MIAVLSPTTRELFLGTELRRFFQGEPYVTFRGPRSLLKVLPCADEHKLKGSEVFSAMFSYPFWIISRVGFFQKSGCVGISVSLQSRDVHRAVLKVYFWNAISQS